MKKKFKKLKKRIKRTIRIIFLKLFNYIFMIIPLDEKKVLFLSDQRKILGGNLECIYNYLENKDYNRVLILKENNFKKRKLSDKFKLVYHVTTSKYIILDDWARVISCMRRRKNQEIVQLWHGPGAFKTFGFSRMDRKKAKKYSTHRNYTKAIVTSKEIRWCFAEGFGMNRYNIKATGFPRTDCLFNAKYKKDIRENFFKKYPELKNKKIVLFAPTYRGSKLKRAHYDFEQLNLKKLKKELGNDYAFIIKWHPAIYNKLNISGTEFDISKYKGFVYDFSNERDINDLLIVTDILITDYSSVIFDYFLLDKPLIYYTYDLDEYNENRGLYFDFEDYVYGDVAMNIDELITAIKKPNMHVEKRQTFNKKFMSACDGNSTEKTYKFIFEDED